MCYNTWQLLGDNMEKLLHILKLNELDLKNEIYKYLIEKRMSPVYKDGFVYAKGEIPILLVAHMDTVFLEPPKNLYYDKKFDEIFSYGGGIGGDDRCGVYAIIKILEEFKTHVLFTEAEEIGGIGAKKAIEKLEKPDVKYIIEFDRRGSNDCIFYECGNKDFINYVESFGFVINYGTFSDISILGSKWDIAAVNLSIGYYNEHTNEEFIRFKELENNIERAKLMIKKNQAAKYFDYQQLNPKSYFQFQYRGKITEINEHLEEYDDTKKQKKLKFIKQKMDNKKRDK